MTFSKNIPLPQLRSDVKIYRGPDDSDGSPTYNCLDPMTAIYYKISWKEFVILKHLKPGITLDEFTSIINKETTLKVTSDELLTFFDEAAKNKLLKTSQSSENYLSEAERKKIHPILWTLYHYLYVRIPLINPDAFLAKTLKYVRPLVSKPALIIYFILIFMGLFFLIERFNEFLKTISYFFTLQGVITYALAISTIKILHEFSHAYTAKYYRLHVPTMGVALIVLWPVLYTDVTDGWKLRKRSQRLAISFAGVATELVIAGLCTLGWVMSEPGLLQSVFFIVSSATWLATVLVNFNPAMRFDGYYMLCDLSGVDNLQPRAFAYTRWQLRKWLLGINVAPPEEGLSSTRRLFMISYTIYTWIYRLILYTVIALFVYHKFTKALGIFLFLIEIAFFIVAPFVSEARQLKQLAPYMTLNKRSIITGCIVTFFFLWFILPLPHRNSFPALTVAAENQTIYVEIEGNIKEIDFKMGQQVHAGDILMQLVSTPLDLEIQDTQADINILKVQRHVFSLKEESRAFLPEKAAELASKEAKLRALLQKKKSLSIRATINGTVYSKEEDLKPGQFIFKNQIVGQIGTLDQIEVICFVPEAKFDILKIGQSVNFRRTNDLHKFSGYINEIIPMRSGTLIYPQLASIYAGELPVATAEENKKLVLVESYFLVRVQLDKKDASLRIGEKGYITLWGPWRSLLVESIRYLVSLYERESSL